MWRKDDLDGLAFNPYPVSNQQIDAADIQVHAIIENR